MELGLDNANLRVRLRSRVRVRLRVRVRDRSCIICSRPVSLSIFLFFTGDPDLNQDPASLCCCLC